MWTRSVEGKTVGRQVAAGPQLDKVGREVGNYKAFLAQVDQIVEVNEAVCDARPISPLAEDAQREAGTGAEKGGSSPRSKRSSPRR